MKSLSAKPADRLDDNCTICNCKWIAKLTTKTHADVSRPPAQHHIIIQSAKTSKTRFTDETYAREPKKQVQPQQTICPSLFAFLLPFVTWKSGQEIWWGLAVQYIKSATISSKTSLVHSLSQWEKRGQPKLNSIQEKLQPNFSNTICLRSYTFQCNKATEIILEIQAIKFKFENIFILKDDNA